MGSRLKEGDLTYIFFSAGFSSVLSSVLSSRVKMLTSSESLLVSLLVILHSIHSAMCVLKNRLFVGYLDIILNRGHDRFPYLLRHCFQSFISSNSHSISFPSSSFPSTQSSGACSSAHSHSRQKWLTEMANYIGYITLDYSTFDISAISVHFSRQRNSPEYSIFASFSEYGQSAIGSSLEVISSIHFSPSHLRDALNALHVASIRLNASSIVASAICSSSLGVWNMHLYTSCSVLL